MLHLHLLAIMACCRPLLFCQGLFGCLHILCPEAWWLACFPSSQFRGNGSVFPMFLHAHPISLLFPARTEGRLEDRLLFEGTKILYGSSCHVNCCVLLILSLCEEKQTECGHLVLNSSDEFLSFDVERWVDIQSNLERAILIHFNHSDLSSDVKFKCQVSGEGFERLHYRAPLMVWLYLLCRCPCCMKQKKKNHSHPHH